VKALSLWQPWASLIAIGAKRVETRGWGTSFRGQLAIHAALRTVRADEVEREMVEALRLCWPPTTAQLRAIPLGVVVATCRLVEVCRISELEAQMIDLGDAPAVGDGTVITPIEAAFGNYAEGRFAWMLADVKPVDPPRPARGARGLWEWTE
jgi:hypothetical protein